MEIWKAVEESGDKRLQAKCKHALYIIERTLALYKFDELAFSFNGGKDSTVLLHLLRAGYSTARAKQSSIVGEISEIENHYPIRTIYFESPDAFEEIDSFTHETAKLYNLELEIIRLDFKSGIEALLNKNPIKAIFLGTRIGDPNAVGQEQFAPSSIGWPPFMRVNPILDWSYRDVWAFLLACHVPYCKLYDQGYTSIGSIHDTVPNAALGINSHDIQGIEQKQNGFYKPAYMLRDGRLERAGRLKKQVERKNASTNCDTEPCAKSLFAASILVVGDEILRGETEDQLGPFLNKKLHSIGWAVTHRVTISNDIDAIAEEVEQRSKANDLVFVAGGVGPMHPDVSLAGVAKAFGVRLAPDEEFEEFLRQQVGELCPGDQNKMARLPEGITELWHHKDLSVPVIKCRNVFVLSGTTIDELGLQWQCLLELSKGTDLLENKQQFISVRLHTSVPELELAGSFARICTEYPDISVGCYRESITRRINGLDKPTRVVLTFVGTNIVRVHTAVDALKSEFPEGSFHLIVV